MLHVYDVHIRLELDRFYTNQEVGTILKDFLGRRITQIKPGDSAIIRAVKTFAIIVDQPDKD